MNAAACNLSTPYKPVAVYYEEADSVEYLRADVPCVYRRVDDLLTLVMDIRDRDNLVGFRLKGFKSYYLDNLAHLGEFVSLVGILERQMSSAGHHFVEAYNKARVMALEDKVSLELTALPRAIAS
jgi:hypothetical protein